MDTASNSVAPTTFNGATFAAALPGATAPLGYFDPLNFCAERDEETIRFLREVEIKHARVAMLAALGFPVAEQFHPLFASDDAPSYVAFQQTPLQTFWPVVVGVIAVAEVFSVFTFENPGTKLWGIRKDHVPGDLGFDPLGLKPSNAAALAEMQTKELNNGRLAMIAIAGMVGQELATGSKLF
ncbi:light harvesting protein [Emiliania huxleyi CCMP1516]|nr:light harvesting protein [Emiliania huxleyi CCMP1516]EOD40541.1 light harvesting protein [Emiliania huxleyi CCMP1516]|eukprot:XP_005792970.1 light harvesting protein [Emiliania huxleyi CCMP1516]